MPRGVPKNGKRKPRGSVKENTKGKRLQKKTKEVKAPKEPKLPKVPKAPKVPSVDVPDPEDLWEFEKTPAVTLPAGFVRLEPLTKVSLPEDPKYGLVKRKGYVSVHPENTRFCFVKWTDGCSYWVAADSLKIEKKPPTLADQAKFYKQYDKEVADTNVEKEIEPKSGQKTRRVSKGDSGGGTGVVGKTGRANEASQEVDRQRQEAVKALALESATTTKGKITLYKAK